MTLPTVANKNENHDYDISIQTNQNKVHACKLTFYCQLVFFMTKTKVISTGTEKQLTSEVQKQGIFLQTRINNVCSM
jgi:hypothetical protein